MGSACHKASSTKTQAVRGRVVCSGECIPAAPLQIAYNNRTKKGYAHHLEKVAAVAAAALVGMVRALPSCSDPQLHPVCSQAKTLAQVPDGVDAQGRGGQVAGGDCVHMGIV